MLDVPSIRTPRLLLRAPARTDVADLATLLDDFAVSRMTGRIPHPYVPADAAGWLDLLAGGAERAWVIEHEGRLAGGVGLTPVEPSGVLELGYWIGQPFWRRGFATEAARTVVRHAFCDLGAPGLFASHFVDNPASGAVIGRCGFRPAGTARRTSLARGSEVDCLVFRLAPGDVAGEPWMQKP